MGESEIGGQPVTTVGNVGEARIRGVEAEVEHRGAWLGGMRTAFAAFSWNDGDDLVEDEPLFVPPLKLALGLGWTERSGRVSGLVTGRFVDGQSEVPEGFEPDVRLRGLRPACGRRHLGPHRPAARPAGGRREPPRPRLRGALRRGARARAEPGPVAGSRLRRSGGAMSAQNCTSGKPRSAGFCRRIAGGRARACRRRAGRVEPRRADRPRPARGDRRRARSGGGVERPGPRDRGPRRNGRSGRGRVPDGARGRSAAVPGRGGGARRAAVRPRS